MIKTKFKTTILSWGNNTAIEVPPANLAELGTSKKPPVMVTIGPYQYPSTVASMEGKYLLPFAKEHRDKSGLKGGDSITVELTLIEGTREVELPEALKTTLLKTQLLEKFNAQSYSNRKEWVRRILEAKKPETLQKRLDEIVTLLPTLKG